MSHKYKEVHAAAAEVLGMVLAFKEEKKDVRDAQCIVWEGHCSIFFKRIGRHCMYFWFAVLSGTSQVDRCELAGCFKYPYSFHA